MNVEATEEELRSVAEVLKLAAILDDRAPAADMARIAAWAEQIHRHKLERRELLDGLQAYYDSPSERAIQIGDLIFHARAIRRDRNEREAEAVRERRAEITSTKAADDIQEIVAGVVMGPVENRTDRLTRAELRLQTCHGKECQEAIREYFAAKAEAKKSQPRARAS